MRGGEGTPRVHGQDFGRRGRKSTKRGVRVGVRVPIFVRRVGGEGLFQGAKTPTEPLPVSVPVRSQVRLR